MTNTRASSGSEEAALHLGVSVANPKQGSQRGREEEKSREEMEAEGVSHMDKSVRTHTEGVFGPYFQCRKSSSLWPHSRAHSTSSWWRKITRQPEDKQVPGRRIQTPGSWSGPAAPPPQLAPCPRPLGGSPGIQTEQNEAKLTNFCAVRMQPKRAISERLPRLVPSGHIAMSKEVIKHTLIQFGILTGSGGEKRLKYRIPETLKTASLSKVKL